MNKELKQPSWCSYPDANAPTFGCWSLLAGMVTDEKYCRECDCHNNNMPKTMIKIKKK